jgi:glycine cleavage system H protein
MAYPPNYRYTKEHEWINVAGDTGTVGITDHAQSALGDIVYVDLPSVGATCTAMKAFGTVESVKAVSELYSPASGEVLETNEALKDSPELLNQDPHGKAWLIKIRLSNPAELSALMSAEQYAAHVAAEKEKQ